MNLHPLGRIAEPIGARCLFKRWPVGGEAKLNQGMPQMFKLMNAARISVGIQGLSVASSAFLNALEYAKDRKQGASITHWKDPTAPRVPIIEHADVRRMLLDMKARVEAMIKAHFNYLAGFFGCGDQDALAGDRNPETL